MPLKLLFKLTTRSRYLRAIEALDSIYNNLANKEDFHVLVSMDVDDTVMAKKDVVDTLNKYKNLTHYYGISHSKIDAINRDVSLAPPFDVLINFSDDQKFLVEGFDDIIRQDIGQDKDLFIHYPDSHTFDKIPTMSIMTRGYFERTNRIYHESFESVYADNFAMDEAKYLGKYKFVNKSIYDHFHPAWGTAEKDEQYLKTEHPNVYNKDRETYYRLKLEFGY